MVSACLPLTRSVLVLGARSHNNRTKQKIAKIPSCSGACHCYRRIHLISTARHLHNTMGILEIKYYAQLLEWAMKNVGKEGPFYIDCGIIDHNLFISQELYDKLHETGTNDTFQIGKAGQKLELEDILSTFRAVSKHKLLCEVQECGNRSYFHEGFRVSKDGKTIEMRWGS